MKDFKLSFISMVTMLILICGCEKEKSIQAIHDDKDIATIAGTWIVVSYDDFVNNTQITKDTNNTWPQFNNGDVIMTFRDTLGTGLISGITVTNGVGGTYTISAPRKIDIVNFEGDYIDHPEWADLFWETFRKAEEFSVNKTQLRIFYNAKKNSIYFEKI